MMQLIAAIITILGAIYALEAKELMRGVLGLAFFFLGISIFFGSLGAWFLAVGQIFLFVGGVVTLFVLAFSYNTTPEQRSHYAPATVIAVLVGVILYLYVGSSTGVTPASIGEFAGMFFERYGLVLNAAILVLFSAVMSAQYIMTEDRK